jgi:hypothetical protein
LTISYVRCVAMPSQAREASAAVLSSGDENALALSLTNAGRSVIVHRGRHWIEAPRGFYQPIHWLARLRPDEASMPRRLTWCYRATVGDEDGGTHANGALPVHLLAGVAGTRTTRCSAATVATFATVQGGRRSS